MNSKKKPATHELEADVVIIGGGAAGLPAAITARENGAKKVILIEKRINVGGNASRAEGLFGAESRLQKKVLIDASCDAIYKRVMEWHHYSKVDPRILRAYLRKSGQTIDWLEDKGIIFHIGTGTRLRFDQLPTWHIPEGKCASIVKVLTKSCQDLGVEILLRTSVKKILLGNRGEVKMVLAVSEEEKREFEVKAKSVVIATGGFGGNNEMLKKYFPYYNDTFFSASLPLTGDGITLAAEAGAAIEDYACLLKETGYGVTRLTFCIMREPYFVCVNQKGQRFLEEDALGYHPMECGNVTIRQPGMIFYALFDNKMAQNIEEKGLLLGRPGVIRGASGEPLTGLRAELKTKAYRDWVKIAASWEEIARWIKAEPAVLKATIEEYNSFCEKGYDETFAKDRRYLIPLRHPPYYAAKIQAMMTDTIGPVRINERMEVLNKQNDPIPGLYAAGVLASGWQSEEYCSEICGSAMGFSVNSGRIAGENATKFSLGSRVRS